MVVLWSDKRKDEREQVYKMRRKIMIIVTTVVVLALGAVVIIAATAEPGSSSDPVVTKSYVDQAIANALNGSGSTGASGGTSAYASASSSAFEVVSVPSGKKVIAKSAAEIVLRSGTALAIGNASNGISDMTDGADLSTNTSIKKNHLILIPRADGRGIKATSDCYVMIRGDYSIQ